MKRLVVIPEDVYMGLMSASNACDPFDKQITKKSQKIGELLGNKRAPSDTQQQLYNQEIKRLKTLKNVKPEAAIERSNIENVIENSVKTIKNDEDVETHSIASTQDSIETQETQNEDKNLYEEDETLKNATPQKTTTRELKPLNKTPEKSIGVQATEITQQLLKRQADLPINEKGQIRRADGTFVQGSHLDRIVLYALDKTAYSRAPNGYNDFLQQAEKHPDLMITLKLKPQTGGAPIKFSPSLWKRF